MNFNDLSVKITSGKNYQSLKNEQKELVNSLIKGYEDYSNNLISSFYNDMSKLQEEQQKKLKNQRLWGTILNIGTLGGYSITKGVVNGISDAIFGIVEMATKFMNNYQKMFENDDRFGSDSSSRAKEFFSDWAYLITDPFLSIGEGLSRGLMSFSDIIVNDLFQGNIDFSTMSNEIGNFFNQGRGNILSLSDTSKEKSKTPDFSTFENRIDSKRSDDETNAINKKLIEEHTDQWARDMLETSGKGSVWFKENIGKRISQALQPQGFAIDYLGQNEVGEFLDGTFESMGRMIPSIVASYFGIPPIATQIYFYSSSFGMAFGEAIEKGSTIEEAMTYAYGVATIESLTEAIGGVEIGKLLPVGKGSNTFTKILSTAIAEGSEEVMSELASGGLESILTGEIDNKDFVSRAVMSFIGGAISGGIFGVGGQLLYKGYDSNIDISEKTNTLYELIRSEVSSNNIETSQKNIRRKVLSTLDSYNNNIENISSEELSSRQKLLKKSGVANLIIDYNKNTNRFELTSTGNDLSNNLKDYVDGTQAGKSVDKSNLAISKKTDFALKYNPNVEISTLENVNKGKNSKIINEIINKNSNIVFVEPMDIKTGFLDDSNGVIYIDRTLESSSILAITTAHEIGHKMRLTNEKAYNNLKSIVFDEDVQMALKKSDIELMSKSDIEAYREEYMRQTNNDVKKTNDLIQEEMVMSFIENVITNEKLLKKVLNLSPKLVKSLSIASQGNVLTDVDSKLSKFEKLFIKYGKEATKYINGSLYNAVINNRENTTFVKVGTKIYEMPKQYSGFFNTELEGNLEASLDETHYVSTDEEPVGREYSNVSKKALKDFFKLFDLENNNNIDSIINDLLKEYENQRDYREIIGTKFAYIWILTDLHSDIRKQLAENVINRINDIRNEAMANGKIVANNEIEGLLDVNDASVFRKIFALNYIISDSRYASSVSLYDTRTYQNEAKNMVLFNDGLCGFVVSDSSIAIDKDYRTFNNEHYYYDTVFNDYELSSVFNNDKTSKITEHIVDYIKKDLGAKVVVATNSKLESIYDNWGFTKNEQLSFEYSNEIMSEWGNSYNNFVLYNSYRNGNSPVYTTLELLNLKRNDNLLKNIDKDGKKVDFPLIANDETQKYIANTILSKPTIVNNKIVDFQMEEFDDKNYIDAGYISKGAFESFSNTNIDMTIINGKYTPFSQERSYNIDREKGYLKKGHQVESSDIVLNPTNEIQLPLEDGRYVNGKYIKFSDDNRSYHIRNSKDEIIHTMKMPKITHFTNEYIIKVAEEKGMKLTKEHKQMIMNLTKEQLRGILGFASQHHVGKPVYFITFYYVNTDILQEFLDSNGTKFKNDGETQQKYFVSFSMDLKINGKEYKIVNAKGAIETNSAKNAITIINNFQKGTYESVKIYVNKVLPSMMTNTPLILTNEKIIDNNGKEKYENKILLLDNKEATITNFKFTNNLLINENDLTDINKILISENNKANNHVDRLKIKNANVIRNVNNGIDNNIEINFIDEYTKNSYDNYNKEEYLNSIRQRQLSLNNIDFKAIEKTVNGKKRVKIINELLSRYERVIKKNYNRSELYNHLFNNVIQEIVNNLSNNFNDTTFSDKLSLINSIENVISQSMAYIDNTFVDNQVNKYNTNNTNGYQYTRLLNWGMRELYSSQNDIQIKELLDSRKLSPIFDLLEGASKLDITDNQSVLEFMAGIDSFFDNTRVLQVNSMALDSEGETAHTIPVVLKQNDTHIENLIKLLGEKTLISKNGKISKYKKTNGLIDINLFDRFSGTRLDMFAFGNIFGMFMENSTGKTMTNRIYEAQKLQLEVSNKFYEYFEKDGFLKKNRKDIDLLEKEVSSLTNLLDSQGNNVIIPNSELIYLRDIMLREIIRDRMIDNGIREGEKSNYFKDGGIIFINGNSNNRNQNSSNRRQVYITNVVDLFNELDSIIESNSFMKKYNEKVLGFFELMYEYENIRNKDITGLELTNDNYTIKNLSDVQRSELLKGFNNVNIDRLYVPLRSVGSNKSSTSGAFNINNVIDLGVDDGMVMGIQENNNPPLIDSINNIVPSYLRSVANFYGLYRTVNDLNILFNKAIKLEDGSEITLADKVSKISPYIIPYYEKLLRDISGYGVNSDITAEGFNKFMGTIRRNFFKASLGLNLKVIATQFASMFTISTIYGDFKGNNKNFTIKMIKNMVSKGSKTKAQYLIENSEIYKDRARNSTYEIKEATSSAFNKSKFNEITEMFMGGINMTDSMINRAFFITLVEMGYSNEQALKMTEEAITRYQSSGLSINKNELLRTQHEVIRVFTKFLGEPMKVVSNIEESIKNLQIINQFEKNQDSINESFAKDLDNKEKTLVKLLEQKEKIEIDILNEKDKAKKKALEKTLKEVDNNISKQQTIIVEQKRNNAQVKKQVQDVINGKKNAKTLLAKRTTALILSLTWQAILGVAFSTLRTGGSDKEEDESTWAYLGTKFGWQMASEMIGYLPFARDVYSLVIDGYDANVVSDFQAFNNLGSSINKMITDISNGGEFNYLKHIRNFSLHLGQIFGIPTKQIERLFTTPTTYFLKDVNYAYRDSTGQYKNDSQELKNAIKNGDDKLVETIITRKINSKGVSLTNNVSSEIIRLSKNGVNVSISKIPDTFSIDSIEYKNDKDKFAEVYNNSSFVIEKIITQVAYKKLDDEHKGKLLKAILNYYYNLAKQKVSGVEIYSKERTYTLNQAYAYFKGRIPYYLNMQKKSKKK